MSNENIESPHRRGSISNSSVRTSCETSGLRSIAVHTSPLSVMLGEMKEYLSVLSHGGSVALHRGKALMGAQLSQRVEKLFTRQPKVDGPPKSWTDIVLWAGPVPRRLWVFEPPGCPSLRSIGTTFAGRTKLSLCLGDAVFSNWEGCTPALEESPFRYVAISDSGGGRISWG